MPRGIGFQPMIQTNQRDGISHRVLGLCSFVAPGQRPKLLRHLATFIYLQLLSVRVANAGLMIRHPLSREKAIKCENCSNRFPICLMD